MQYKKIVNDAYKKIPNIGQNKKEILELAEFVENLNPKNILEIGTQFGGTFYIWCSLASGKKISIDLPNGEFGGIASSSHFKRNNLFFDEWFLDTDGITFISGDSHSQDTFDIVFNLLKGGEGIDFLFIDGDHSYEGVKKDYEMYKFLVNDGGWIGFHDINKIKDCGVDKFWNELEGEKIEFNYNTTWVKGSKEVMGGIGIVKV